MNTAMTYIVPVLRTLSEVLTAAVAMAAFSMLLFSLQFIRRKQILAWSSVPLLVCIVVIYSTEALESIAMGASAHLLWKKLHWTGLIFLPSLVFFFALPLPGMTGRPAGRLGRCFAGAAMLGSLFFTVRLWQDKLFAGIKTISNIGTTMIHSSETVFFWIFCVVCLFLTFEMLNITFLRTKTHASRRRMLYLIVSVTGILIGSFPLLLFGSGLLISRHPIIFWTLSVIGNALVTAMVLLLAYSVTNFSVPWSDRLARLRMLEWILRGPVTASLTLWLVTMLNRTSDTLGLRVAGLNTFATVFSIIVLEYLAGLAMPFIERSSLVGLGAEDYAIFREFQGMMVFKPELETFLEALAGALCDRFQARNGFFAVMDEFGKVDSLISVGGSEQIPESLTASLPAYFAENGNEPYREDTRVIFPVISCVEGTSVFLGVLGLSDPSAALDSEEGRVVLDEALDNARTVLRQRRYLTAAYQALRGSSASDPQNTFRSGSVLNRESLLAENSEMENVVAWTKDALAHYWGGPRLSDNPLLELEIVKSAAAEMNDTPINALRSVLKKALEKLRPEGERAYNGEWILYNIIDLKFFEKEKVKDIVRRLAMSEADFYRKQKVAVEAMAKEIIRMEQEHHG